MQTFFEITERFFIHLFGGVGIILAVSFFLRFMKRKKQYSWLPVGTKATLIWAAMLVFAVAVLREAYDVSQGGWVVKSYIDYLSWALGCGLGTYGLMRYHDWDHS